MTVTFVGMSDVGLISGACLAETGVSVTCFDQDCEIIQGLHRGAVEVYEPELKQLIGKNQSDGRLKFTTDFEQAIESAKVVFITVDTPQNDDGSTNLSDVWTMIDEIRDIATSPKLVVLKSTVPVGTCQRAYERLNQDSEFLHSVATNPDFMRKGFAVGDCLQPNRIVCGVQDGHSEQLLKKLYEPFSQKGVPVLLMEWESAEMTKYVANCVLATKISFINEMANMCEAVGADINAVRLGIGHDSRIGFQFFAPGVGFGGACFSKDLRGIKALARSKQTPMRVLEAVDYVNEDQKRIAFKKLSQAFNGHLKNATVAVWGLAFKPKTDDVREAPAIVLINQLLDAGAIVRAYDLEASENAQKIFGDAVTFCNDKYEAVENADALAIMTEWKELYSTDLTKLSREMKGNVIFDGRNLFNPYEAATNGFVYSSVGRTTSFPGFTPGTQQTMSTSPAANQV